MDIDDGTVFIDAMELHYIDMKAFVKTINETGAIGNGETEETMLAQWLAIITEKDIKDKTIIKNICEEQEELGMVVSELVKLSEDMIIRHAYQKRQDEVMLYNNRINNYKLTIEQSNRRAEQAEAEIEKLRKEIEELRTGKIT